MADIETKVENETVTKVVSSPEKKVVDDEKKISSIEVHEPEVDEEEDSKSSENGETKVKENGSTDEKETDGQEESPKKDSVPEADACCIKRKSMTADATNGNSVVDGASPEKKAKLDDKAAESETNGEAAETKA